MHDDPVIIGIHGLANKPPREEKQTWWRRAIEEGLRRNLGRAPPDVPFEFVYWADLRYDAPLTPERNREPYYPVRGRGPFPSPNGRPPGPTLTVLSKSATSETLATNGVSARYQARIV